MGLEWEDRDARELLARLTGQEAAERLAASFTSLTDMSRASFDELRGIKGVGSSKAKAIRNAFLLAQALAVERRKDCPVLDTPERVAECFREEFRSYSTERFKVICLNTRRHPIKAHEIAIGTIDSVLVDVRSIFRPAIACGAAAILLLHNHPSGVIPHPVLCRMWAGLARETLGLSILVRHKNEGIDSWC